VTWTSEESISILWSLEIAFITPNYKYNNEKKYEYLTFSCSTAPLNFKGDALATEGMPERARNILATRVNLMVTDIE
jgi:hypothetical protein